MKGFLDTRRLRYFMAIAESGSLSAAARALNLAQPALSYHVTELESLIGVRLLDRHHNGVTVTDAGRLLLRHAAEIATGIERAEIELLRFARDRGAKIKLRLVLISSLAAELTPVLVETAARQMPEVVLRITEAGTLDGQRLLDQGRADAAIHLSGQDDEEPLALEQLYFVSAGEDRAPATPLTFAEVSEQPLVMPALGNPLRMLIERTAAETGHTLNVALEIDGLGPRRNAILAGLGSTILGAHAVRGDAHRAGLVVRPIIEPTLFRPIYFAARRGLDSLLVERLRALLAQSLAQFGVLQVGRSGEEPAAPRRRSKGAAPAAALRPS